MTFTPAYLALLERGELQARAAAAEARLACCDLCPHTCKVDRLAGKRGVCFSGALAKVSSYGPHLGEEAPLSGWLGSGTIFFTRCNLKCQYCQNHAISQTDSGETVMPQALASIMLELQAMGCHNINLVSPSHVATQILAALVIAAQAGLRLPLVYNTGGYDALSTLALFDGVIDIYMPDMKYANPRMGLTYSKVRDYPQINREAVKAMHAQVGDLQLDPRGLAVRGLLVRHLVLPHGLAGTEQIVNFLAGEISPNTYLNLMDQYRPAYNARQYAKLSRSLTPQAYEAARQNALDAGLSRLDPG